MSRFDYEVSKKIAAEDYPFYSLIMAAMRQADTHNMRLLTAAFPAVAEELRERYNSPGGFLPGDNRPAEPRVAWEMYTEEGNRACQQIFDRIAEEIRQGVLTRNMLPARIKELCDFVAEQHGEIYDTEPQVKLAQEISLLCDEQGWKPISREEW